MFTRILGTGSYLPEQIRTNADLERMVDTSNEWILERTGISERRIAAPDETAASMGAIAARRALEAANTDPSEIDLVICATTSSQNAFPSTACEISGLVGISDCPAFDLAAACSGFSYGYALAHSMIMSGQAKKVLVVAADLMSRACDPNDRTTIVLFGDGAAACVLGQSETEGTIAVHMSADAKYGPLLSLAYPRRGEDTSNSSWLYMKGNDVFKHAVTVLASLVNKTLEKGNMSAEDLDFLVPHQANLRIIAATARMLKMDMSQVIVTLDKQGNTSAPSVGLALDEGIRSGRIKRGDVLLLESFGGGFTWGSALIRY
uniref:beta-ketoacyl-ACP synthase III n=1 Tax=Succinivibrio sp. TaxID=2053619 RepID=UPI00402AC2E7